MIQDAHGGEALLLPHLPPPQRQDEQPQRAHQEEPRGVLAGKMSFIIIIHYYHSLLSRGVLAGKMSLIIIIHYHHSLLSFIIITGCPGRQDVIHYHHLLLSRGVQAGKMSFIINCEDAFY